MFYKLHVFFIILVTPQFDISNSHILLKNSTFDEENLKFDQTKADFELLQYYCNRLMQFLRLLQFCNVQ